MEHKNVRLIIVVSMAFTMLSASCSIAVTKNIYNENPKIQQESDSTNYNLHLSSQSPKSKDAQR